MLAAAVAAAAAFLRPDARPLEVDVFSRDESKELLQRRDPELPDSDAGRLAQALGDLPLAVEQAATWRAETGMSADEYLTLFQEKRDELLGTSPPLDYELPVQAAWNLSLDRLADRNPAALRLLQVCAFFAPEPIPRLVFRRGRNIMIVPELDAALRDPFKLNMAIREITRYALARVDHRTNSIQMHRLVQAVLRGRMTADERETMRHGAHLLLAANDPDEPGNSENWEQYSELYPHVIAADAVNSRDPFVRDLLVHEVEYLYKWGGKSSPRPADVRRLGREPRARRGRPAHHHRRRVGRVDELHQRQLPRGGTRQQTTARTVRGGARRQPH